jgi:hypothetical protein
MDIQVVLFVIIIIAGLLLYWYMDGSIFGGGGYTVFVVSDLNNHMSDSKTSLFAVWHPDTKIFETRGLNISRGDINKLHFNFTNPNQMPQIINMAEYLDNSGYVDLGVTDNSIVQDTFPEATPRSQTLNIYLQDMYNGVQVNHYTLRKDQLISKVKPSLNTIHLSENDINNWANDIMSIVTETEFVDPPQHIKESLAIIKPHLDRNKYDEFDKDVHVSLHKKINNIIKQPMWAPFNNEYIKKISRALDSCLASEMARVDDRLVQSAVLDPYEKHYSSIWLEIVSHAENVSEFDESIAARLLLPKAEQANPTKGTPLFASAKKVMESIRTMTDYAVQHKEQQTARIKRFNPPNKPAPLPPK